jgi:hypothetical protein
VSASRTAEGATAAEALAAGLSRSALLLAVTAAVGIVLAVLMGRHRSKPFTTLDRSAAAAAATHTIPVQPAGRR